MTAPLYKTRKIILLDQNGIAIGEYEPASLQALAAAILLQDDNALMALARGYDAEDASHMGEPSPHNLDLGGTDSQWLDERFHCAKAGLEAVLKHATVKGPADA